MNSNWFKLVMKMTKVEYGKNLLLKGVPIIFNKGGAKLKIGENVTIKSSFLSNLVGLYSRTIIVTRAPGAEIEIGNNVGISGATIYARKKITIGENTCIGGNCKILDNDFHPMKQILPILISRLGTRSLSPPFSSRRSLFLASASIG